MKNKGILLLLITHFLAYGEDQTAQAPYKYTMINKTSVPVQIIQSFKGWCELNIMDLTAGQQNDLNTPCKMTKICFAIDKKLLTCPIDDECISKDNCYKTDKVAAMEPGVWIIEEYKKDKVPKINNPKNLAIGLLDRVELPTTGGIVYVITRCSQQSCLYQFAK